MPQSLVGTESTEQLITRADAAKHLNIGKAQLYLYMDAASLFLPTLKRLRNPKGGISPRRPLTTWDLPVLVKVQQAFRKYGELGAREHLKNNPQDYE